MRREFEFWYPFDLRVSGKDLIQVRMRQILSRCLGVAGNYAAASKQAAPVSTTTTIAHATHTRAHHVRVHLPAAEPSDLLPVQPHSYLGTPAAQLAAVLPLQWPPAAERGEDEQEYGQLQDVAAGHRRVQQRRNAHCAGRCGWVVKGIPCCWSVAAQNLSLQACGPTCSRLLTTTHCLPHHPPIATHMHARSRVRVPARPAQVTPWMTPTLSTLPPTAPFCV